MKIFVALSGAEKRVITASVSPPVCPKETAVVITMRYVYHLLQLQWVSLCGYCYDNLWLPFGKYIHKFASHVLQ